MEKNGSWTAERHTCPHHTCPDGIGLESAREFLHEGAQVAITGLTQKSLELARNELENAVHTIVSDASDAPALASVAESIREVFGKLDILFVNAGIVAMRPLKKWTPLRLTILSTRT